MSGELIFLAGSGGQGSFSYGDPGVVGPRGIARAVPVPLNNLQRNLRAGLAGGAHILNFKGGSFVQTYSPNGLVILRLTKVE